MGSICVYLTDRQSELLDLFKHHGIFKSKIIRDALEMYIHKNAKQPKSSNKKSKKEITNKIIDKRENKTMNVNLNLETLNDLIDQRVKRILEDLGQKEVITTEIQNVQPTKPQTLASKSQKNRLVKVKNIYWINDEKNSLVWALESLDDPNSNKLLYKNFNPKSSNAIAYMLSELKKLNVILDTLTKVQEYDWSTLVGKILEVDVQKKDDKDVVYFLKIQ